MTMHDVQSVKRCWHFIAEQPTPAPHLARPEEPAALRMVLITVPRLQGAGARERESERERERDREREREIERGRERGRERAARSCCPSQHLRTDKKSYFIQEVRL